MATGLQLSTVVVQSSVTAGFPSLVLQTPLKSLLSTAATASCPSWPSCETPPAPPSLQLGASCELVSSKLLLLPSALLLLLTLNQLLAPARRERLNQSLSIITHKSYYVVSHPKCQEYSVTLNGTHHDRPYIYCYIIIATLYPYLMIFLGPDNQLFHVTSFPTNLPLDFYDNTLTEHLLHWIDLIQCF